MNITFHLFLPHEMQVQQKKKKKGFGDVLRSRGNDSKTQMSVTKAAYAINKGKL